ncbi:PEGA domain-containing protein [Chondromyces crocatus]|nr:PEGA domain-containing protein [Chondromyces crocatus]
MLVGGCTGFALASAAAAEPPQQVATPASGAPASGPPARRSASVEVLLQRGAKARDAGRWAEAVEAFGAAWKQVPSPERRSEIAGELGVCEVVLGRYRDAAEHLHVALEGSGELTPVERRRFELAQVRAEREVATVAISSSPITAEVFVDGRSLGAPRPTYLVFLDPGRHALRASLPGHRDALATVTARAGATLDLGLALRPLPPEATATPSLPRVGATCPPEQEATGATAAVARIVGYSAAGVSLALGAGLAFGAASLQGTLVERSSALGLHGCSGREPSEACKALSQLAEARDRLAGGAMIGFVAAGTLGAAALASTWWTPWGGRASRQAVQVLPAVSPTQAGAAAMGRW